MWFATYKKNLATTKNLKRRIDSKNRFIILRKLIVLFAVLFIFFEVIKNLNFIAPKIKFLVVTEPILAQTILTILLLFVTAYYAIQAGILTKLASRQRKDNFLPVVIGENFSASHDNESSHICLSCDIKNIGIGPAFNIIISFYDKDSGDLVLAAGHDIDYIEKESVKTFHIHINKEVWKNIKYVKYKDKMVADFIVELAFHDIFGCHRITTQGFVLNKDLNKIQKVLGTFQFERTT